MQKNKTIQRKWLVIAMITLFIAIVFIYFYRFSPLKNDGFFPFCMFKSATGLDCVGCGGQRAVHELLHFNFRSALDHNALFVLSIPLFIYFIYNSLRRYVTGKSEPNSFWYSRRFGIIYILIVLIFFILRNIPIYPFYYLNSFH